MVLSAGTGGAGWLLGPAKSAILPFGVDVVSKSVSSLASAACKEVMAFW